MKKTSRWLILLLVASIIAITVWSITIINKSVQKSVMDNPYASSGTPSAINQGSQISKKLIVGGDDSNPPFSYLENGVAKGLDIDLMSDLAAIMGMTVEFRLSPSIEAKQQLLNGEVDVIGGMSHSEQREHSYFFGSPHAVIYYTLFVRKDSTSNHIKDLTNGSVIILNGDVMAGYLEDENYSGKIEKAESCLDALTLLASGKFDGALLPEIQSYYYIDRFHLSNLKAVGQKVAELDYSYVVTEKNQDLTIKLNQAFAIYQASGKFSELQKQWLSLYQQAGFLDSNRSLIYALVTIAAIFLIVLLWVVSLRRQVQRRTRDLRVSEEKYRQLIDNATEGVFVLKNNQFVYCNPQALTILGNLDSTLLLEKLNLIDVVHSADYEMVVSHFEDRIKTDDSLALLTFRIISSKGVIRYVRSNAVRIDWENEPAVLAFFSDITEERKLEETLRASEERYRQLFSQTPIGLFYFNNDLVITNINDRFVEILQSDHQKLNGLDLHNITDKRVLPAIEAVLEHKKGYYEGSYKPSTSKTPMQIYIKMHTTPLVDEKLQYMGGIGIVEDITDQVKSERRIKHLEERFSKAFFTSPDAISITRLTDGEFLDVNRGFIETTGYSREEIIGKKAKDIRIWKNDDDRQKMIDKLKETEDHIRMEAEFRLKDGREIVGLLSASVIEVDNEKCTLVIMRDIDEIRRKEVIIRESEKRFRTIFESVPVSIWEQDFLHVYDMLEDLRVSGVTDLEAYLDENPKFVQEAIKSVRIVDVNPASLKIFKARSKEELFQSLNTYIDEHSYQNFKNEIQAIWEKRPIFEGETINKNFFGEHIDVAIIIKIPENREDFARTLVSITDITERKRSEEALRESEIRYRQLVEQVNITVYMDYYGTPNRPQYISPQIESLLGYTAEEWLADDDLCRNVIYPDDLSRYESEDTFTDLTGEPFIIEYRAFTKTGRVVWIHEEAILEKDSEGNRKAWHGVMYDVTDRKSAELALQESEKRYKTIFDSVPVSIKEEDFSIVYKMLEELRLKGITNLEEYINIHPEFLRIAAENVFITDVNQETLNIFKAESKNQLLRPLSAFFTDESYPIFLKELLSFWNKDASFKQETINRTLAGEKIDVWFSINNPSVSSDLSRTIVSIVDITERKKAEEQIKLQVRYLAALRAVDMAISASMDLPITLRVLLNQITQHLNVDSAAILLFDSHTQTLKFGAGIGFSTQAVETTVLRLGQSYAGQVALERRIIVADDLQTTASRIIFKEILKDNFSHYMGIPLISKGVIKGVLELFNRSPFIQNSEWMNLVESMAGQASIAIENATLLDEVQKVNINLRSAYDSTIEGWARSLDIRDGDMSNHSKYVADMTVELAQISGYRGEGLLHMRRGALLHDIGKMGIPDSILQKPGPLTEEEWEVMRQHPEIGKKLLNTIDFLQPAIEIPYYHHERWDGTGYPEKLKGSQIPLSARVFAIVDCWNVLRADRPWRKAMSDADAWNYIEDNAGKAFDPQIVEKFRQLLGLDRTY